MAPLLVVALLVATMPVAWAGLIESRAHGGIPGWKTFNPDLRQTAFASQVNRATRPGDILYFHSTFAYPPPPRMDWAFYYDRDLRRGFPLRALQRLTPAEQKHAVAIVLPASLWGDELRAYAELCRQHPVLHVDDLAMLDLRANGPATQVFTLAPVDRTHTSALRRWIEGPYPWPRLVPDAPARVAADRLVQAALAPINVPATGPRPNAPTLAKQLVPGPTRPGPTGIGPTTLAPTRPGNGPSAKAGTPLKGHTDVHTAKSKPHPHRRHRQPR